MTDFNIIEVPGDGHCLLHCLSKILKISTLQILNLIEEKISKECESILAVYGEIITSKEDMLDQFHHYKISKRYNQAITQLVLEILPQIFQTNLFLYTREETTLVRWFTWEDESHDNVIRLLFQGDHYKILQEKEK